MSDETRCRSCQEPIRFERTESGRLTPISLKTGLTHFADCPQRQEWRKTEQPTQGSLDFGDVAAKPEERRYPT